MYITDCYQGNQSLNSGVPAVTNTLVAVVSGNRKLKGPTRCSLLSRQRILLRGWLTELTGIYRQTADDTRSRTVITESFGVLSLCGVTHCYSYSKIESVIINCSSAWRITNKSSVKSRTHKLSHYQANTQQYFLYDDCDDDCLCWNHVYRFLVRSTLQFSHQKLCHLV
jgi:hypothetical protein